ncbi:pyridoxamine 5'-phosphate oxidase family protein [Actinophytocola sp.]|uniref:pyridoxamine 5'-phosphate oxidase family protein n=1 Tax=Actinophytocola sp. TaxID=1872138 RepID=UPI002ED5A189
MTETQPRRLGPEERAEALRLLGSVPYGRIVFTERALPAISPVSHIVDRGDVIVRVYAESAVLRAIGQIVAYEADHVDENATVDWSVVVIGVAEKEERAEEIARYDPLLTPALAPGTTHLIRIRPEVVTAQLSTTR